jgi:hypothetical protein
MAEMATRSRRGFLDGLPARILALVIFLACVAAIVWIERARERGPVVADDAFARCLAEREDDLARMQAEGMVDERRAASIREGAAAMCRAIAAGGGGGLGPPQ